MCKNLLGIKRLGRVQFPLRKGGVRGLLFLCTAVLLLFGTAVTSEAFMLPDTGQTKCYQGVIPYAEIPCASTGQDGAYNINSMSFTDNGNGTVTANNTKLMQQQKDYGNTHISLWFFEGLRFSGEMI